MKAKDLAESLFESSDAEMRMETADYGKIAVKLRRSAELGSSRAAYALGTWYLHGRGVLQDHREAVGFLQVAADARHCEALYELGACYFNGEGVEKDHNRAFELYLHAALQGHPEAIFRVGRAYYYGDGVVEDRRVAEIWFDRAEELGTFEKE